MMCARAGTPADDDYAKQLFLFGLLQTVALDDQVDARPAACERRDHRWQPAQCSLCRDEREIQSTAVRCRYGPGTSCRPGLGARCRLPAGVRRRRTFRTWAINSTPVIEVEYRQSVCDLLRSAERPPTFYLPSLLSLTTLTRTRSLRCGWRLGELGRGADSITYNASVSRRRAALLFPTGILRRLREVLRFRGRPSHPAGYLARGKLTCAVRKQQAEAAHSANRPTPSF